MSTDDICRARGSDCFLIAEQPTGAELDTRIELTERVRVFDETEMVGGTKEDADRRLRRPDPGRDR